jgi:pimeloyl-ACP methyl ester carboxylesterase
VLIPVNGVEVSVSSHGADDGHPLLLVHGFTGRADDWAGVVDDLSALRRVITIDHRGHGESTNTGDASTYTFDQLVADLAAVVDALELERFDLLGHSMGGIVAMRYALASPERLTSLVLMDTGAAASSRDGNAAGFMRAGIERAREHGLMAVYEGMERFLPEDGRATIRRNFELMDPVAFGALGEELLTHESVLDRLASLRVPTTVLVGEHDTGLRGAADDLAATIPGAHLVVIPDAGHSPQTENRSAWLEAMHSHLD